MSEFYTFSAQTLDGTEILFEDLKDEVVLVVNTASECGFTPQYAGLEKLHKEFSNQGLTILGFPCNQFGKQEPGDVKAIKQTCLINYGVTFPIMKKGDVNGKEAQPLFSWLKEKKRGIFGTDIKWNFTKFLIGRDGKVLHRFGSLIPPALMKPFIQRALRA